MFIQKYQNTSEVRSSEMECQVREREGQDWQIKYVISKSMEFIYCVAFFKLSIRLNIHVFNRILHDDCKINI